MHVYRHCNSSRLRSKVAQLFRRHHHCNLRPSASTETCIQPTIYLVSQVMDSPILPLCYRVQRYLTVHPMTYLRALVIRENEPHARVKKKKKVKKNRKRKKSIIGIQMEDHNRIRGVEHGVQRAS